MSKSPYKLKQLLKKCFKVPVQYNPKNRTHWDWQDHVEEGNEEEIERDYIQTIFERTPFYMEQAQQLAVGTLSLSHDGSCAPAT